MNDKLDSGASTRRTFLKGMAGSAVVTRLGQLGFAADRTRSGASAVVELEDSILQVAFDAKSGALTGITWKPLNWTIHQRPELGISFRMHAPLPDRRDNFILGQRQTAKKVEKLPSGNQIRIVWDDLVSEHGGVLPIQLSTLVTLENGALTFSASLENESALVIETVEYPYVGDLQAPKLDAPLWRRQMWYDDLQSQELHPHFNNAIWGYWGFDSPMQTGASSASSFCLIESIDQGIYVGLHDPNPSYLVQYTLEQKPGVLESIHDKTPAQEAIAGTPVHLEFRLAHFLFAAPKSIATMLPVVLRPYRGNWQAGFDIYKGWRKTWFQAIHIPDWAGDVHSWQQVQMNSPEDELRFRYSDLVKIGEECAHNGVRAIQVVGWNRGGQDRGNPCLDTDPRLGTFQDLRDAIARVQAMGVKIILFAKFVWADKSTEWYQKELYRFAACDPYGEPYENPGYSYRTPTQFAGINNRRFAVMCPVCEQYRKIAANEFSKIIALGANGMLYDEVCHHATVKYCFAKDHGHAAPAYIYAGDVPLAKTLQSVARSQPDFLFAGEAPQDILMQHYPFSYFRISAASTPAGRYLDPHASLMVAVTGFDDRETLNRALMYRYVLSYEPYDFKGQLGDFPLTLEYGKKIDALRHRYRDLLWETEFLSELAASVSADGQPYHLYSVFRNVSGNRAVVIVNEDLNSSIKVKVELRDARNLRAATPEQPDPLPTSGTLVIPARSATVLMEGLELGQSL